MSIVIRTRGARDILKPTDYFRDARAATAIRFTERLAKSLRMLEHSPDAGADMELMYEGIELRSLTIPRFSNYFILYGIIPDGIVVARVLDGRRDWATPLEDGIE